MLVLDAGGNRRAGLRTGHRHAHAGLLRPVGATDCVTRDHDTGEDDADHVEPGDGDAGARPPPWRGVAIGVLLGLVVASAALRARGLQVSLVTLALGIAVIQFFFVRSWIIGPPSGLHVPDPSIFGWRMATSRSLMPVLVVLVALASV